MANATFRMAVYSERRDRREHCGLNDGIDLFLANKKKVDSARRKYCVARQQRGASGRRELLLNGHMPNRADKSLKHVQDVRRSRARPRGVN